MIFVFCRCASLFMMLMCHGSPIIVSQLYRSTQPLPQKLVADFNKYMASAYFPSILCHEK